MPTRTRRNRARKNIYSGGRRKLRQSRSVMGRLMPPVDITSPSQVGELDKRISIGPITLVLVYADWCGHCQRFKPMMEQLENMSGRTVQTARIRDDMVPQSSLKNAKLDGYPSLLLIKNGPKGEDMSKNIVQFKKDDGEVSSTVPDYTNMAKMTALVKNVGTPAGTAALNASVVPLDKLVNGSTIVVPNAAEKTAARMASPAMNTGTLPSTIVADRLSANTVNELNSQLVKSGTALSNVKPMFSGQAGGQAGGSLFAHLSSAATSTAPAAVLFLAASQMKGKKGKTKKQRGGVSCKESKVCSYLNKQIPKMINIEKDPHRKQSWREGLHYVNSICGPLEIATRALKRQPSGVIVENMKSGNGPVTVSQELWARVPQLVEYATGLEEYTNDLPDADPNKIPPLDADCKGRE